MRTGIKPQRERSEGKNAFWSYFLILRISFIISKCDAPFERRPEKLKYGVNVFSWLDFQNVWAK